MKLKSTWLTLLAALVFSNALYSQNPFRSASTGDWTTTPATRWEEFVAGVWQPAAAAPDATSGTITIQSGHNITVGLAAVTADQIVVDAGGTLTITNTLSLADGTGDDLDVNGTLALGNTLNISAGTPTVTVDGTFNWTGGTLAVPATLSGTSTTTVSGANKTLSANLTNNGTFDWNAANINFSNAVLTNNAAFNMNTATAFVHTLATSSLVNSATGTVTKTIAGNTTSNVTVDNAGTINIQAGTLIMAGANATLTNSGTINFTAGTQLTINSSLAGGNNFNAGTVLSGTGTISSNQNTNINLALTPPPTITITFSGAAATTLGGSGSLNIPGILNFGIGTLSVPTTIDATGTLNLNAGNRTLTTTLTNNGTVDATVGNISFNNGTIDNNAAFNIIGTTISFTSAAGTNLIDNSGVITKTAASTGTTLITSVPVTNTGTLNIDGGIISKTGAVTVGFNNSGPIVLANSAAFQYNAGGAAGLLVLDPGTTVTGTGTFRMNANTTINVPLVLASTVTGEIGIGTAPPVGGTGSLTADGILNWGGGNVSVPITIGLSGTLNSTAGKTMSANLTNNGIINLTDPATGSIALANSIFTNNGTINDNFVAARSFSNGGGVNSFINNGTYLKANAVTTTWNAGVPTVNNVGASFGGDGTLTFTGGITNSGFIDPGGAGNANIGILNISENAIESVAPFIRIRIDNGSGADAGGHDSLNVSTGPVDLSTVILLVTENTSTPVQSYVIMTAPGPNGFQNNFLIAGIPLSYSISIDNTTNPSRVIVTKLTATLPLVWGEFTALGRNNKVQLDWSTLSEENTSHFVLEHSVDGRTFTSIASVPAAGNSNIEKFYAYTHNAPNLTKNNHYRIQQVDLNGRATYSAVRTVKFNGGKVVAVQVAPNPVKNSMQLTVQLDNVNVVMTDRNGATIRTYKFAAGVHNVNVADLPAGVYQLGVYEKNQRIDVIRIVKQ